MNRQESRYAKRDARLRRQACASKMAEIQPYLDIQRAELEKIIAEKDAEIKSLKAEIDALKAAGGVSEETPPITQPTPEKPSTGKSGASKGK